MRRRAEGHCLLGPIGPKRRYAREEFARVSLYRREACAAAEEQEGVEVGLRDASIGKGKITDLRCRRERGLDQLFKLGARERVLEVFRSGRVGCDEGREMLATASLQSSSLAASVASCSRCSAR